MIDDTEILVGFGADLLIFRCGSDCLFIEFQCFLRILFFLLRFQTVIVKFDRSRILVFPAFFRGGNFLRRHFRIVWELNILRGEGSRSGKEQPEKKHGSCRGSVHSLFRKTEPDAKQEECSGKRINRTLDRAGLFTAVDFLFCKFLNARLQLFQTRIGRRGTHVNPSGFLGKNTESAFVQRAFHDIALGVLKRMKSALSVGNLNQRRLGWIADTCDKQRNFEFDDFTDSLAGIPVKLVAVGDQENGAMRGFRGAETVDRRGKRLFNIGASDGNRIRIKVVKGCEETGLVNGERAFQKSLPGKGNESETVAGVHLYKFTDKPFRMFKARGAHILCKHASRGVENHHDIASLSGIRLDADAPGRTRRRSKKKNQSACKQNRPPETACFRGGSIRRVIRAFPQKTLQ